ncbi:MAG: MerR family transcriptional regulator [Micromonosporaceae bacterium]
MTVGELSARTGVPVKTLREYADTGLVYTAGRSPSNYRLFDEDALWCVQWIGNLRSLGLTVAEIRDLAAVYSEHADQPKGPHLAQRLTVARNRLDARITELQRMRDRIDEFTSAHRAELAGDACVGWLDGDPRRRRASA